MKKFMTFTLAGVALCLSLILAAGSIADAKIKVKKPSISVKKKTKASVKFQISSKNKKMTGYKIYQMKVDDSDVFRINLGWKKLKTIKVKSGKKKVSYTVKKLKANTKYKFKVVAYRSYKGKKVTAAKTKSVKTLKAAANNKDKKDDKQKDDSKTPNDNKIPNNDSSNYQQKMLDKVNQYRREAGVPELKLNQDLCNIALMRAKKVYELMEHDGKRVDVFDLYAHSNSVEQFKDYYETKGLYYYYRCAENANYELGGESGDWEAYLNDWMCSSGHKRQIMSSEWTDFGVAFYGDVAYQTFENRNIKTYFWDDCNERGERAIHRYHTTTGRYPEGMNNWCSICNSTGY